MEQVAAPAIRTQLLDRRRRLADAIGARREITGLHDLLREVDAALERVDDRSYGICESCHEPIEPEQLRINPLIRYCLPHLTPDEQRALEQDLDLASHIQRELLPKQNLSQDGWEIAYHYEPLGPVSRDHCDVFPPEADGAGFFFVLGDVSGKGIAASMFTAHLRAIFRTLASSGLALNRQVARANRIFCESTLSEHFATMVFGKAGVSGEMEIVNAGHCPPLWIHGGDVTPIEASGLPLGIFCSGEYPGKTIQLTPGDTLLLYTDGFSEAANPSDEEYGMERLSWVAMSHGARNPQALIGTCLDHLGAHLGGAPKQDDLTMMAIQRSA